MSKKRNLFFVLFLLTIREGKPQRNEGDRCVDANTNTVGVCLPPDRCDSAVRDLMNNGINPTFCVRSFSHALVCCRDGTNILNTASNSDSPWVTSEELDNVRKGSTRISERKCTEYSRGVTQTVDFFPLVPDPEALSVSAARCNYARVELIVGGVDAELGEFPHMAAIGWPTIDGGVTFKCGGTLISERFVLTAGHCLQTRRDFVVSALRPTLVRLGDQNLDPAVNDGANPIEVPIKTAHKHPNYEPPLKYHDIALLELTTAVELTSSVRPACLWRENSFGVHTKALATGWGVTSTRSQNTSNELQKVSLDLVDSATCNRLLEQNINRNWNGLNSGQLCAGILSGNHDTCQGDSGGPLQVALKENQCVFYVIGVTAFGGKCAQANQPGVYTRVSEYLDWIESVVWPNGD